MADLVEIVLRLRGARQFAGDMDKSSKSVDKLGRSTEHTAQKAKTGWKSLGKFAANSAMVYGAGRLLKSTATATQDLAKGTMALNRSTGMEAKTASAWVSVLKTRDIDTKQFNMSMVKLSKTMEAARGGNKKAAKSLADLGVSGDMVAKGDVQGAIMASADALSKMTNPAEKATAAQMLFGRAGQKLLPLLSSGSAGIEEQLAMAEKYGAVVDDKGVGSAKNLIAAQRELQLAQAGVKVQMGTALLPVMVQFSAVLKTVVGFMGPLLKNSVALRIVIIGLTVVFIAYKVAVIAATISAMTFNAALLLIPLAIAAIVVGLVVAYNKVGWFRAAVDAAVGWIVGAVKNAFNWIKTHWPLLVAILGGPFVALAVVIIRNRDKIVGAIKALPGMVTRAASGAFNGLKNAFRSAVNWIIAKWNGFSLGMNAVKVAGHTVVPGMRINTPDIPPLARGGTIARAGAAIVGERGPEMVRLPQAAQVIPNGAGAGAPQTIVTQVFLDRRQIAEAVGSYASDRIARR